MPLGQVPLDLASIYRAYHKGVYNYIYARILRREVAEDLTADVFVAAAAHLGRFALGEDGIAPWLFTVARNVTLNYRMRASTRWEETRETLPERAAPEESARDDSLRAPDSIRAERILSRLSDAERDFLELRYAFGLSNGEVGARLGLSPAAVSQRYHRLLEKCRKLDEET